jgi:hypothetical protein
LRLRALTAYHTFLLDLVLVGIDPGLGDSNVFLLDFIARIQALTSFASLHQLELQTFGRTFCERLEWAMFARVGGWRI